MKFRIRSFLFADSETELDMAPMIDVVFLLIIFFMVSTTFVMTPGIKLDLPSAVKPDQEPETGLVVTISADGSMFLNREPVALNELTRRLFEQHTSPEQHLTIRADETVQHGLVVQAMDAARQAGIYRMAIATEPVQLNAMPEEG